jgi:uncharacterized protein YpiB (UPF0302 family)
MYDNYISKKKYRELKGLVCDIIDGENHSITEDELIQRIEEAYDNDEISGTQYDHLMNLLG